MGIQGRLNVAVGLAALGGLIGFALYNFSREQQIYEREAIVRKGLAIGKALSVPCLLSLASDRPEQIDQYLAEFRGPLGEDLDLVYVAVLDRNGQVVSHTKASEFGRSYHDSFSRKAVKSPLPVVQKYYDQNLGSLVSDIALPLKMGGSRWGTLRLGLTFKRVEESVLWATVVGVFASIALVACLLIFLRWRVNRDFIDPVYRLSEALSRLRAGQLVKVAVREGGELGALLQNFNQAIGVLHQSKDMREKLERIEKITRGHRRLEQAHRELKAAHRDLELAHRELEEAKDRLVRTEKLVSIGQLTAGLAHEINNPINYVSNSVSPLKEAMQRVLSYFDESPPENAEIAEDLQDMQTSLDLIATGISRTARIVKDLRDYSHMGPARLEAFDLHEEIEKALTLLANKLRDVTIEKKYCAVTRIEGYPGLLGQVLINLLDNAIQAMDGSGVISIATRQVRDSLSLSIKDTGLGIPREHLPRVFDPFFTSKKVGEGTGLGLAFSHSIVVERHSGTIAVESKVGKGTEFTITLPLKQAEQSAENAGVEVG